MKALHLQGQAEFNHYAEFPHCRWVNPSFYARCCGSFASTWWRMWSAWDLFQQARHALSNCAVKRANDTPSRFMRIGGVVIVTRLLLWRTTWGWVTQFDQADPYRNVVIGYSNRLSFSLLLAGTGWLGLHLFHGVGMFQTLGYKQPAV